MIHPLLILQATVVVAALAIVPARTLAASCPTTALFTPVGVGTLDAGWAGYGHDLPLESTPLSLALDCGPAESPCGTCPIMGILPTSLTPLRCAADPATPCTIEDAEDDCGAADACRVHLGPPQSLGLGGLSSCMTIRTAGDVGGTVDIETGAFNPVVPVHVRLSAGLTLRQGCPRCVGDPTANDGLRDGTCDAGPRDGLACDAQATSSLTDFGSTSFDCLPDPGATLAEYAIGPIAASTGTLTRTLTATSPGCSGEPGKHCFCATCNSPVGEPCASNADCPLSGGNPGICGGLRCVDGTNHGAPCTATSECPLGSCTRPGKWPEPNSCVDTTDGSMPCADVGDGRGLCQNGPVTTYCENHPNRGCLNDSDCDGVPGSCTAKNVGCFLDNGLLGASVTVGGTATPPVAGVADPTDLAVLTCLPHTGISLYYDFAGLPGLMRSVQPGRLALDPPVPTPTPIPDPCSASPAACRPAGAAQLQLTDRDPDDKDRLQWQWKNGTATTAPDFGNPTASDTYALCLYDDSGLRATLEVPPGGTCQGKPCWRQKTSGFLYRNKDATPSGVTQLTLKASSGGKATLQIKGKGGLLPLPALSTLNGALDVQIRNRTSGRCWGTRFLPPFAKDTDELLKAKAD